MEKTAASADKSPPDETPVRIDVERLSRALASGTVEVPPGLSRDEMLRFILAAAAVRA